MSRKYMDLRKFEGLGYLQELNRNFLHPLGLSMEIVPAANGNEAAVKMFDGRDNPEGVRYDKYGIDDEKSYAILLERFTREVKIKGNTRMASPLETSSNKKYKKGLHNLAVELGQFPEENPIDFSLDFIKISDKYPIPKHCQVIVYSEEFKTFKRVMWEEESSYFREMMIGSGTMGQVLSSGNFTHFAYMEKYDES